MGHCERVAIAIPVLVMVLRAGVVQAAEPVAYSASSVEQGAALFKLYCTQCHGADGRAQVDVIADATDLTEPELYRNGTGVADIYRSINEGAGVAMPAWGSQLRDPEDVWHLVNFVQSLWPEGQRPAVE